MERTTPLGTIKNMTTGTLSRGITVPGRLAARAFGVARGAAAVGRQVAEGASRRAEAGDPAEQPAPEGVDTSQPVNVVEELGLDPAPVDETTDTSEPVTAIDAQADPDSVDVTPADVADQIGTHRQKT